MPKRERKRESFMKSTIDNLFAKGEVIEHEFLALERKREARTKRLSQESPIEQVRTGRSVRMLLSKLSGELLTTEDLADFVHYATFGNVVRKPKWVSIDKSRQLMQICVVRVNSANVDFFETCNLYYLDDFFCKQWFVTSKNVCNRIHFWNEMLNVKMTMQEQVKEMCRKSEKRIREEGTPQVLDFLMSPEQMADNRFPFPGDEDIIMTKEKYLPITSNSPFLSIDCEMCQTDQDPSELTRISIVNIKGDILLDTLVKPRNRITDYLTKWSGITEDMLENVETRLEDVQKAVQAILPPDAILVGHSLQHDLRAMKMAHPYCIDASIIFNYTGNLHKNGLKSLTDLFLNEEIQNGYGHCSYEDAWAAMRLVQLKLDKGLIFGNVNFGWDYASASKEKLEESEPPKKIVKRQKDPTRSTICRNCEHTTVVNCTVENCQCQLIAGPSYCVHCQKLNESIQGNTDWKESLVTGDLPKHRPITHYLKDNKLLTVKCAIDKDDLPEYTRTWKSKKLKWSSPKDFETNDEFIEAVCGNMMDDKLVLVDLEFDEKMCNLEKDESEEDGELPDHSTILNGQLEKLINSICNNSLILVVVSTSQQSILYTRVKQ